MVHHHVQARRPRQLRRLLVDDVELQPQAAGLDGDGFLGDGQDISDLRKQSTMSMRAGATAAAASVRVA